MRGDFVAFAPHGDAVRWIDIAGEGDPVVGLHGLGCHGAASSGRCRVKSRAVLA